MTNSTFASRTKAISKNSQGYKNAHLLLTVGGKIHTCHTSGRGRYTTNLDYTADTIEALNALKLVKNVDFVVGNDAPKGGLTGNYVKLTSRGKAKMIAE